MYNKIREGDSINHFDWNRIIIKEHEDMFKKGLTTYTNRLVLYCVIVRFSISFFLLRSVVFKTLFILVQRLQFTFYEYYIFCQYCLKDIGT